MPLIPIKYSGITKYRTLTLFITIIICAACQDDDTAAIFSYDASEHIYGTFAKTNEGIWEVIIDPSTGHFKKIEGTEELAGGISNKVGAKELTSFERNERIYIPVSGHSVLKIQNLETFSTTDIEIKDNITNETIIFPQIIKFGSDQTEVYILDTDDSIWKIDVDSQEVSKIYEGIPLANNRYIYNFFYIASTGHFLCMTNSESEPINGYRTNVLFTLDPALPDSAAIISSTSILDGFGFVQDPIENNSFYYIQLPDADTNFRLMKLELSGNEINVLQKSTADLPIDNLSIYLQTIHSASNTYILRGGTNSFEMPSNTLYSIDLNNGNLVHQVNLAEDGFLLKLAGE